jgi:adenine-specific DNA-methyltransferase
MSELQSTINSARRAELRRDKDYIHIMKYMGSKRELLPDIKEEVLRLSPEGKGVLDIFAGTGSVGNYLKKSYNIVSNDIQEYSQVIANALICSNTRKLDLNISKLIKKLEKPYFENIQNTENILRNTLKKSSEFLLIEKNNWNEKERRRYLKFIEEFPSPVNIFKTPNKELEEIKNIYFDITENRKIFVQTIFLFGETYFGLNQCIDIDSIRYAIDKSLKNKYEKDIALTALIYAYSYCSSSTGHFAQFRDLKDLGSINDVFLYRKRKVWVYFLKKLEELVNFYEYTPNKNHISLNMDYMEIFKKKDLLDSFDLVYADPPYSFVHYSRFYHATESLIKYDYIRPEFKGRYRTDRHQSPFCQKLNVEYAFTELFKACSNYEKKVLLSYSDTGMICLEKIIKIAEFHNFKTKIKKINYNHSTLGREKHKSNLIKEYLISCDL